MPLAGAVVIAALLPAYYYRSAVNTAYRTNQASTTVSSDLLDRTVEPRRRRLSDRLSAYYLLALSGMDECHSFRACGVVSLRLDGIAEATSPPAV